MTKAGFDRAECEAASDADTNELMLIVVVTLPLPRVTALFL